MDHAEIGWVIKLTDQIEAGDNEIKRPEQTAFQCTYLLSGDQSLQQFSEQAERFQPGQHNPA